MVDYGGQVIEFLDSGALKLAFVSRVVGKKIHITDQNGRQRTITEKNVIIAHGASCSAGAFSAEAPALQERVEELRQEVDTELLWESVQGEASEVSLAALATGYFGRDGAIERSAVFRAVFADPVRFRVRGATIVVRTPDDVETQMQVLRKRREKEALRARALDWMAAVLGASEARPDAPVEIPEDLEPLVRKLEGYLRKEPVGRGEELLAWLQECGRGSTERETAYEILRRVGRLRAEAEPFLVMAGIIEDFPADVVREAVALSPFIGDPARRDFSALPCFSIDDAETREVDDALTVQELPGRIVVGIHIADVARFVSPGGELEKEAFRRGSSIYLPNRSVPMFPPALSHELASLREGELRATMSFVLELSEELDVLDGTIVRGQIRVSRRLDYDEADRLVEAGSEDPVSRALATLDRLSAKLLAARQEAGALTIRRPELRVRVVDGQPSLRLLDGRSVSQRIVSELMIRANQLAAAHAVREEIPIIFRAQEAPTEKVEAPEDYDPVRLDALFRTLRRSELSTRPRPHAGLGLECYTQLTSPIRRLTDLVLQRQFAAHLDGEPLPFEREHLFEVLHTAQTVESEAREVEGRSTRYWVLRFLADNGPDEEREAVVVRDLGQRLLIETRDYCVRGVLPKGGQRPGDVVMVRIDRIDPKADVLAFRAV